MTRLCVGNLSSDVTQGDLRETFAAYGPVRSVYIMMDDSDGGSKSLGFIEMSWQAHALAATQALDGTDLKGRSIRVSRARPRSDGGSRGNPPRGGASPTTRAIAGSEPRFRRRVSDVKS